MKKYSLYTDVLAVKGFNRSLLFDTTRFKFYFISNDLFEVFSKNNFKNIESSQISNDFYSSLLENELIHEADERIENCLVPMSNEWDFPFKISSFVVVVNNLNITSLLKFGALEYVANFHFIINSLINSETIDKLKEFIEFQISDSIEFSFLCNLEESIEQYLLEKLSGIKKIIKFYNYSNVNIESELNKVHRYSVSLMPFDLKLSKYADHYFESLEHHTYFNRRVFISENGNVKNSEESNEIYGCINEINNSNQLLEIIDKQDFQKLWFVKKENIDICKDCEFRNICTDKRLPIQRNQNEWYHKKECVYNPYISKWNDDEGYLTLKECGIETNFSGFQFDKESLVKLNQQIWGEDL